MSAVLVCEGALLKAVSAAEPGLNGLVDGVGLDVLEVFWAKLMPLIVPTGDILDGRVPARPRRAGLLMPVSVRGTKSGKPSWDGDSGISKRGVDVPLPVVGGPQMLGDSPLADCNSLVRLGNSRCPCSCKGEPAPTLAPDKLLSPDADGLGPVKGDFEVGMEEGSVRGAMEERLWFSCSSFRGVGALVGSSPMHV